MHTDLSSQMACLTASFTLPQRKLSHSRARGALRVQAVKVGDALPDVTLTEGAAGYAAGTPVPVRSLFANKKGILFAVPGAFTPTCSKSHLPSYVQDHQKLKDMGIDVVACVATNDHWVMHAWGESAGALGKVRMLSDGDGALAKALGMTSPSSGALTRSKRYSMVVVDNKVVAFNDAEAGGSECTMAGALVASLPALLAKAGTDPLEAYCATDPSADECRVYSD